MVKRKRKECCPLCLLARLSCLSSHVLGHRCSCFPWVSSLVQDQIKQSELCCHYSVDRWGGTFAGRKGDYCLWLHLILAKCIVCLCCRAGIGCTVSKKQVPARLLPTTTNVWERIKSNISEGHLHLITFFMLCEKAAAQILKDSLEMELGLT